jgi:hypothetical protein
LFLFTLIPCLLCAQTRPNKPVQHVKAPARVQHSTVHDKTKEELRGRIVEGNVYRNPALDMTITLPGEWQFLDDAARDRAEGRTSGQPNNQAPACKGPLCGDPEINIALIRNPEAAAPSASTIFVAGFKLPPEYLDRGHYPLKHFAEVMLPGSSGKSGLVISSDLVPIELGGRPAYRLLLREPNAAAPKEAGYVTESNGYMILLVGAAEPASELANLQSAIEGLQFGSH